MEARVGVFALPLLLAAYHLQAQDIPSVDVPAPYRDGTFFAERCAPLLDTLIPAKGGDAYRPA